MTGIGRREFLKLASISGAAAAAAPAALLNSGCKPSPKRPHIVFILADDLGWNNVGYHGGHVKTPRLDRLAASGAKLEQFYVQPLCSPTRSSLLTGRYPMRMGLQVHVITPWDSYGMPLEERTLAEALRDAGYRTAICGKWHLGAHEPAYLPTRRGFDHQYGHYSGAIDYFKLERDGGHDWHRDDKALYVEGYATDLIADESVRLIREHDPAQPLFLYVPFNAPHLPMQAPQSYIDKYMHVEDENRRIFAAMVTAMDDAIGRIIAALDERGMRTDTLILFCSDNGGPTSMADNTPLRAGKGSVYEGGVRVPAIASWPGRIKFGTMVNEPMHIVDMYPTLLKLAGADLHQTLPLDGVDVWPTIAEGKPSPRTEILIQVEQNRGALRQRDWKLIVRGELPDNITEMEFYNLAEDPGEINDLAAGYPKKVEVMKTRLLEYAAEAVPPWPDGKREGFKIPKVWGERDDRD